MQFRRGFKISRILALLGNHSSGMHLRICAYLMFNLCLAVCETQVLLTHITNAGWSSPLNLPATHPVCIRIANAPIHP